MEEAAADQGKGVLRSERLQVKKVEINTSGASGIVIEGERKEEKKKRDSKRKCVLISTLSLFPLEQV